MRELALRLAVRALLVVDAPTQFHKLHRFKWYGETLRAWAGGLGLPAGGRILEIGCGPGGLTRDLAEAGYRVTGIDHSKAMIRMAKHHAKTMKNMEFRHDEALKLPFKANSFDAVIAASVINVVRDKPALVSEMARVVSPDGVLSVLFPTADFTPLTAAAFARRHGLDAFQNAMLGVWARNAPKLAGDDAVALFRKAALDVADPVFFLDGLLTSVTARKDAKEH